MDNKQLTTKFLAFREEKKKEMPMSTDREKRPCEQCGQIKPLSMSYEKLVCGTCISLRGSVKLRPTAVIDALREFHGPLAQWLTDTEAEAIIGGVPDKILSDLKEVRAAVEALKAENEALRAENSRLTDIVNQGAADFTEIGKSYREVSDKYEQAQHDIKLLTDDVEMWTRKYDDALAGGIDLQKELFEATVLPATIGIDRAELSKILLSLTRSVMGKRAHIPEHLFKRLAVLAEG